MIRRRLESDVVARAPHRRVHHRGRRQALAPALVFLAAGATGYRGEHHVELAAVVEFIHTATLLHDDVVDESELRRGRKTANAEFGNAASVLVGDFLYSRAFQIMVRCEACGHGGAGEPTNAIAEGEVLQLLNAHNSAISEAANLELSAQDRKALRSGRSTGGDPGRSERGARGRFRALRHAPRDGFFS